MDKGKRIEAYCLKKKYKIVSKSYNQGYSIETHDNYVKLDINSFPENCGMRVITGFEEYNERVKGIQFLLLEYVKYQLGKSGDRPGLLVYTINSDQKYLEPILKKAEFELMWKGVNPHHGDRHVIKMFGYNLHKYKKDEPNALPSLR